MTPPKLVLFFFEHVPLLRTFFGGISKIWRYIPGTFHDAFGPIAIADSDLHLATLGTLNLTEA